MANQPQGLLPLQGELQNVFFFLFFLLYENEMQNTKLPAKKFFQMMIHLKLVESSYHPSLTAQMSAIFYSVLWTMLEQH